MILGLKAGHPEVSRVFGIILGRRQWLHTNWKEVLSQNSIGVNEENHKKLTVRIDSTPAEIRTEHFQNTCLGRYGYTHPYRSDVSHSCPESPQENY